MAEENKHPPTTEEQAPPEMPGKAPKMEQAEIPDVGGGPAPSAKVIDLSAMRSTPEKDAPPDIPKEMEALAALNPKKDEAPAAQPKAPAQEPEEAAEQADDAPAQELEEALDEPSALETALTFVDQDAAALISAIGEPLETQYEASCSGPGDDGVWTYDGFTVYTYRENGVETIVDAE